MKTELDLELIKLISLPVATGSQFLRDTEYVMRKFEEGTRVQSLLITADDVLSPEVLKKVVAISNGVMNIATHDSKGGLIQWGDVCFK